MITDAEIVALIKHPPSREEGFRAMLKTYQKPIYYFVRRMVLNHDDADDLTQNTFIKAWKALEGFRGDSKVSTWLHTIAYHEAIHFISSKHQVGRVPLDQVHHQLHHTLANDELYTGDEIQRKLQVAIAALPEKQKAVFIMKYFEEMKYEEMAEVTGTSVGALKASYHHAVQKIEESLKHQIHALS